MEVLTSLGPPGLWLAVSINAPVALDPCKLTFFYALLFFNSGGK